MATICAYGCSMYCVVDDFSDPWRAETVWLQHGVGRSTRFTPARSDAGAGVVFVCRHG